MRETKRETDFDRLWIGGDWKKKYGFILCKLWWGHNTIILILFCCCYRLLLVLIMLIVNGVFVVVVYVLVVFEMKLSERGLLGNRLKTDIQSPQDALETDGPSVRVRDNRSKHNNPCISITEPDCLFLKSVTMPNCLLLEHPLLQLYRLQRWNIERACSRKNFDRLWKCFSNSTKI